MKLLRYKLASTAEGEWSFEEVFFGRINLLVGDSGTGKTRFLNTIINFINQLISDKIKYDGDWDIDVEICGRVYSYSLVVGNSTTKLNEKTIIREELIRRSDSEILIKRDSSGFYWKDEQLPKLSNNISSIALLKEEDEMKEIFQSLRIVVARRFFADELNKNYQFGAMALNTQKQLIEKNDVKVLLNEPMDFHNKINLIKHIDKNMYDDIINLYKQAFPFVEDATIKEFSQIFEATAMPLQAPVFCIKERGVKNWIPVNDISSGMQKIFLLILDLFLMGDSGIMLIDEYENSLGINAINFLPDLIHTISKECQFILTSHHPYIINTLPIENWLVFHREGMSVKIKSGKELKKKYEESRQEQFIQLINDPFYVSGIE